MTVNRPEPLLTMGSKHQRLALHSSEIVASGGEGTVYLPSQHSNLAAKIYHRLDDSKIENKLTLMINNPPSIPSGEEDKIFIAWPADILRDSNNRVLGFVMRRVSGRPIIEYYSPRKRRETTLGFSFTYEHLLATARNLARVVEVCHGQRYIIGDLNESNVLVSKTASVSIIDTDSFQVINRRNGTVYRSPVGKPEYIPPELHGRQFDSIDRTQDHDLFSLAVIMYQLLMDGVHPFTGAYTGRGDAPPLDRRIAAGHFPYSRRRTVPYTHSPIAPPWDNLHPSLRDLFLKCFDSGHDAPGTRPTGHEWAQVIDTAVGSLTTCGRNPQHKYFDHLPNCPWCVRARRRTEPGGVTFTDLIDRFLPRMSPTPPAQRPSKTPPTPAAQDIPMPAAEDVPRDPAREEEGRQPAPGAALLGKSKAELDRSLWNAAWEGNVEMVRLLMEAGADPYRVFIYDANWFFTKKAHAIEIAVEKGFTEVVKVITDVTKSRGA